MSRKTLDLKAVGLVAVLLFAAGAVAFSGLDAGDDVAEVESVSADSPNDNVKWVNTISVEKNGEVVYQDSNTLTDQGTEFIAGMISEGDETDFDELVSGDLEGTAQFIALGNPDHDSVDDTVGVCDTIEDDSVASEDDYLCGEFVDNTIDWVDEGYDDEVVEDNDAASLIRQTSSSFEASADGQGIGEMEIEAEYTFNEETGGDVDADSVTVKSTGLFWSDYTEDGSGGLEDADDFESLLSGAEFDSEAVLEDEDELTVTHEVTIEDGS